MINTTHDNLIHYNKILMDRPAEGILGSKSPDATHSRIPAASFQQDINEHGVRITLYCHI